MSDDPADLSEEADELLAALAAAAGGEAMISARQDASNMLVSTSPDVLWTPMGGQDQAVPYPVVVAPMDKSIRLSMSVRNNGNYDFQLNSRTTYIKGHEKGIHKGVVVPGYQKYSHAEAGADYLFSQGFANVSHGDHAWINRDEVGPTEPQRELGEQQVAYVTASTPSASPYGALAPSQPGVSFASPSGPVSPYGGLPGSISTVSPQPFDSPFGPPTVSISARSRRSPSSNQSRFTRNAHGRTNVKTTAVPKFATDLMSDLARNQKFTPDEAAGFAGNAGGESAGFTQFHETIAATYKKDASGNFITDANGKKIVDKPQHLARPREGGRGVIQWTASRRDQFKKLIARREGNPYDRNTDFPDSDYTNYGNNEAMIEQDLNGEHKADANTIRLGDTSDVPQWAQGNDLSVATWHDFSTYEQPKVYGDWADNPNAANTRAVQKEFNRRLGLAKVYLNEHRKQLAKTGGG